MLMAFAETPNKYFEISKNIEIFTNLYKELNLYYVDEVDPAKLMRLVSTQCWNIWIPIPTIFF